MKEFTTIGISPKKKFWLELYCKANGWKISNFLEMLTEKIMLTLDWMEYEYNRKKLNELTEEELNGILPELRQEIRFSDIWVIKDIRKLKDNDQN